MTDQVNFGDELVSPEEKTRRVGAVFSSVARRYDLMNDLMSGGMHRLWKDRFVARVKPRPGERSSTWPAAPATSPSAWPSRRPGDRRRHQCRHARGRPRARRGARHRRPHLEAPECRGAELRRRAAFDAYTIAFGIRNVTDIPAALREAHRVLKRGGRFFCMEFSTSDWPGFAEAYEAWASTGSSRESARRSPRRGQLPLPRRERSAASRARRRSSA